MTNPFLDGLMGGQYGRTEMEMKNRITKLEGQVADLLASRIKQRDNIKKLNELMRECIRRVESK